MESSGRPRTPPMEARSSPKPSQQSKLVGAASRSYNVASTWDQSAPLTDDHLALIDQLSALCTGRAIPEHIVRPIEQKPKAPPEQKSAKSGGNDETDMFAGSLEDAVLHTSQKFYQWHSKLEALRASEAEEKYREYGDVLSGHLDACDRVSSVIDGTLASLDEVLKYHRDAVGRSRSLRETGERIVDERQQLVEFASVIRTRLSIFEELETIASEFHKTASTPFSLNTPTPEQDPFLPLLQRLDKCIAYVTSNPQYAESELYANQFKRLHAQALAGIRHRVAQTLKHAVSKFLDASGNVVVEQETEGGDVDGAEAALLYVRFRADVEPRLKGLIGEIEGRASSGEYSGLLGDCEKAFCQARMSLMSGVVQKHVAEFASQPLEGLVRNGFAYLVQVCRAEHQLFHRFFPSAEGENTFLSTLMDDLGNHLYDVFRPILIQTHGVEELCELVEIIMEEVMHDQIDRWGESVEPLRGIVHRTLADSQQRLTYRAQAFIREDIAAYEPKVEDLQYPQCLERPDGPAPGEDEAGPSGSSAAQEESQTWYPPLRMSLVCLSKLYHCLEPRIFGGLAHEAVSSCANCILRAGRAVGQQAGRLDGQLFTVRHLLLLREQIAVFKAEFSVVEKDLDFTHMRDHMRRILMGEASLFTFSSSNAMVQLVSRGAPRVLDNQIDSKKRLEKQLKGACEELIMAITKMTVEPMLSFITKVTLRAANSGSTTTARPASRPLRELAFASMEKVTEMVSSVNSALEITLVEVVAKMKLYLPSPNTRAILFKPIKSNIAEAHTQVATIFQREYEEAEIAGIALLKPEELSEKLEALN